MACAEQRTYRTRRTACAPPPPPAAGSAAATRDAGPLRVRGPVSGAQVSQRTLRQHAPHAAPLASLSSAPSSPSSAAWLPVLALSRTRRSGLCRRCPGDLPPSEAGSHASAAAAMCGSSAAASTSPSSAALTAARTVLSAALSGPRCSGGGAPGLGGATAACSTRAEASICSTAEALDLTPLSGRMSGAGRRWSGACSSALEVSCGRRGREAGVADAVRARERPLRRCWLRSASGRRVWKRPHSRAGGAQCEVRAAARAQRRRARGPLRRAVQRCTPAQLGTPPGAHQLAQRGALVDPAGPLGPLARMLVLLGHPAVRGAARTGSGGARRVRGHVRGLQPLTHHEGV